MSDTDINPLTIQIKNSENTRKTNMRIPKETKYRKPKSIRGQTLSTDQKWRVYKTKVEPKLLDKLVEDNPDELLATIKKAINERTAPNLNKILNDAQRDNMDLNSEIISQNHIDTSLLDKSDVVADSENANSIKNDIKSPEEASQLLQSIVRRKNRENLLKKRISPYTDTLGLDPTFTNFKLYTDNESRKENVAVKKIQAFYKKMLKIKD